MSDSDIFIAVGSNINPHENIERALTELNSQIADIGHFEFLQNGRLLIGRTSRIF